MDKVYSLDGERYFDWEDIIEQIKSEHDIGEVICLYEADQVNHNNDEFINSHQILENIAESACDEYYELAEDYNDKVRAIVDKSELELLISDWLKFKGVTPEFFSVENVKETEYTVE